MKYLFMFAPLLLAIASAFYFNKKRLNYSLKTLLLLALTHGVLAYSIIMVFFTSALIIDMWMLAIVIVLFFGSSFALYKFHTEIIDDVKNQVLTVLNVIVLFAITLLPFYVSLQIFRFMDLFLQILLSTAITVVVFSLSRLFAMKVMPQSRAIIRYFLTWRNGIKIGIPFLLLILCLMIFNFPMTNIEKSLNLSNSVRYMEFESYPVDAQNNYDSEIVFQGTFRSSYNIVGYVYDNNTITLLTEENNLIEIDRETLEIETSKLAGSPDIYTENVVLFKSLSNFIGEPVITDIVINGTTYRLGEKNTFERYYVHIIDEDNLTHAFNHEKLEKLTNFSNYRRYSLELYKAYNDHLEFIQYDDNTLTLYRLVEKETTHNTVTAKHYDLGIFFWITLAFIFPLAGKELEVDKLSFENAMNGKYVTKEKDE